MTPYYYLALGDSYTIGESVKEQERFPVQTVNLLRSQGFQVGDPLIVATTGWTTDELEQGIREANITETFDIVTLLIGVNNQYRGRSVAEYREQFTALLQKAIGFAGNIPSHVVVLSIPDWGATPYAEGRDKGQIAAAIDAYNDANRFIAAAMGTGWLDITRYTREAVTDPALVAPDGLHPSGKDYARWSQDLALMLQQALH